MLTWRSPLSVDDGREWVSADTVGAHLSRDVKGYLWFPRIKGQTFHTERLFWKPLWRCCCCYWEEVLVVNC